MTKGTKTYQWCIALLLCLVQTAGIAMYGQDRPRAAAKRQQKELADTLRKIPQIVPDSLDALSDPILQRVSTADSLAVADSIAAENKKRLLEMTSTPTPQVPDTPADSLNKELNKKVFIPNPTKATWLALVIPGGGQIYNRKYWKLPIIYGGFAGCAYALSWNGKMYKDYSQAYLDIMDSNPNTKSYEDLLPPNAQYNEEQLKNTLKRRKDSFRRFRDLSIFAFIGVYLISIIDAYVDAELSNFDISPDLSMKLEPTVIDNNSQFRSNSYKNKSVGLQCVLRF